MIFRDIKSYYSYLRLKLVNDFLYNFRLFWRKWSFPVLDLVKNSFQFLVTHLGTWLTHLILYRMNLPSKKQPSWKDQMREEGFWRMSGRKADRSPKPGESVIKP